MRVLMLVTNDEAEFFRQQVDVLTRQGVDVDVLAVPSQRETTDDADEKRSVWQYVKFYPQVLKASFGDYDLVHANYGLTGPPALAQPNLPVVLSLWGSDVFGQLGALSRFCARHADATVVMTEEMAAAVGGDCEVVPHGVDLERFRPFSQSVARDVVGWRDDARHVLFPYATQREVKDFPLAERVVDRVRERMSPRVATAGGMGGGGVSSGGAAGGGTADGGAGGGGRAGTAGVDVELQTIHDVPHDRMPLYLNAADAMLLTSKSEGSPNAVKEALACNTPVVSTAVGDVPERVEGVRNAFVADDPDGLVRALETVLERGEPSDGRESVRPISAAWMGERLREIYADVLR